VAIQNGASLVPVYCFGETDLYDQLPNHRGTLLRKVQTYFQKLLGFSIPLCYGRGIFNYKMGLMPHRASLNVVVGSPIDCPCEAKPSDEMINEYHDRYLQALKALWDDHKDRYALNRRSSLRVM
jgi:2-acylglycerol O-acyltransferase 2